ncbi:MAG: hypothetical protein CL489_09095 [Acidobacteria bacterium]|nr:hypothetical protein [Acidobacteriota bacterium]
MQYFIDKILSENASIETARPELLAIHKRAINTVHESMVSIQQTTKPTATVYGARYFYNTENGNEFEVIDGVSFGGVLTYTDVQSLDAYDEGTTYNSGQRFRLINRPIEVLVDGYQGTAVTDDEQARALIMDGIYNNQLRIVTDGASRTDYDDPNKDIQDVGFIFDRWNCEVRTRKFRLQHTLELLKEMQKDLDSDQIIRNLIAIAVAEEINLDIINKINLIAKKSDTIDISGNTDRFSSANELLSDISTEGAIITRQTTYKPTFVIASSSVVGRLQTLNGVKSKKDDNGRTRYYIESSGIELIIDRYALGDYYTIGAKDEQISIDDDGSETTNMVAPLYFSPYNYDGTGMNSFATVTDPKSLQPVLVSTTRYGLCASPYSNTSDNDKGEVIDGEDWVNLAGSCELARSKRVIL